MHFIVNCVAEASISVYFFHVCYGSIYLMIDKWPSSIVDDKRTHTFLRVVFVMQINTGTNWDHHCNITTGKTVMSCSTKPIFLCKRFSNKPNWITTIAPQSVPAPHTTTVLHQCHANQNRTAILLHLANNRRTCSSRCSLVLPLPALSQLMVWPTFASYGRCYHTERQLEEFLEFCPFVCVFNLRKELCENDIVVIQ